MTEKIDCYECEQEIKPGEDFVITRIHRLWIHKKCMNGIYDNK